MTAPGDLQTIDEIIALVEFEPELSMVFVEGRMDALLYAWYLEEHSISTAVMRLSDRVVVMRDELPADVMDYGEREKLNALAIRVAGELPASQRSITIILDADWSSAVGPVPVSMGCRLFTDFPSLEFYFLEAHPFDRFVRLGLRLDSVEHVEVIAALSTALRRVASVRLTLHDANIPCIASFVKLCTLSSTNSDANVLELLRRSLNKVDRRSWPAPPDELVPWAAWYQQVLEAAGHPGRGHDIAPMLIEYFGLKNDLANPEVVERLMCATADATELDGFDLFRNLLSRFS